MLNDACRNVEVMDWAKARDDIKNINPALTRMIDKLSPGSKYKLIKATYCFADLIIRNGELQLPSRDSRLLPISHPEMKTSFGSLVNYTPIPLAILLSKASEVFVMDGDYAIPLKFLTPGDMFGTFEILNYIISQNSSPLWNVSAGSRSLFTLPKISEEGGFRKLKNYYNLQLDKSRLMMDHWDLFRQIANHPEFEQSWTSEVLFFTKDWFSFKDKDPHWQEFQLFLFKKGWAQSQSTFERQRLNLLWQVFVNTISKKHLNPSLYLINTLKHLFLICIGEIPAFVPTVSDLSAPCQGLQSVLLNLYGLKKYNPIMMNVKSFVNLGNDLPLYYSLAFPTMAENGQDKISKTSTLMLDLKDLKNIINIMVIATENLGSSFFNGRQFDFFHIQADEKAGIKPSYLIPEEDNRFTNAKFLELDFCATSPFWRGCVRIKNAVSA